MSMGQLPCQTRSNPFSLSSPSLISPAIVRASSWHCCLSTSVNSKKSFVCRWYDEKAATTISHGPILNSDICRTFLNFGLIEN